MAGFEDIIGHNKIVEHLKNAIVMDKVSHAYIFNGEDNSGKMMLAHISSNKHFTFSLYPNITNGFFREKKALFVNINFITNSLNA